MFGEKISQLGNLFKDRLDPDLVEGALDYIQYNGEPLAFEILCDHISEYDIAITSEEYGMIANLVEDMELDMSEVPFNYMKNLIL